MTGIDVWHDQRIIADGVKSAEIYGRLSVVFSSDTLSCLKVFK